MESLIRFIRDPSNQYKPRPPRAPCPECGKELSIKWGEIKRPHLFHVRRDVKCSESLEHLLAKMIVRDTLNNDEELEFTRPCPGCRKSLTSTVKLNDGEIAKEECHLGDRKHADVAVTKADGTVRLIVEILHTNRTKHREGEWYEVRADDVIDKHSTGQRMSLNDVRNRSSNLCTCCVENRRKEEEEKRRAAAEAEELRRKIIAGQEERCRIAEEKEKIRKIAAEEEELRLRIVAQKEDKRRRVDEARKRLITLELDSLLEARSKVAKRLNDIENLRSAALEDEKRNAKGEVKISSARQLRTYAEDKKREVASELDTLNDQIQQLKNQLSI